MPIFSIIIATHSRPVLLERAIASVKAQDGLAQLVVVSDTVCEATHRVCSAHLDHCDLFIQRSGQPGPSESRNVGLRNSSGDFILFLDDDDALCATYLRDAAGHLRSSDVVYTDYYAVQEYFEGESIRQVAKQRCSLEGRSAPDLYVKNFIPSACLVYPRAAIIDRRFDSGMKYEDWDFLLNVYSAYPLRHLPIDGPFIHSRITADNRGRENDADLESIYRKIYGRWPAPTLDGKVARQSLFASVGLSLNLEDS